MDSVTARALEARLKGVTLDGWEIGDLINHGKSAAVFHGRKDGAHAAVKIFDSELIERYGDNAQLARIDRELELRGHRHENIVGIYAGGHDSDLDLYFIVMEYVNGLNLKDSLSEIKIEDVPLIVSQVASAAEFLETIGLVHRDIKPENIVLKHDGSGAVLLDFGVVRPIAGSDITDANGIHAFIGTLQYSSPEFLLREEEQTKEGFRALTFYQIGAVMHDLITKKPIFEHFMFPYGKLVNAVQHEKPFIGAPGAPAWLIQVAQRCLLKKADTRLRVVRWSDFHRQPSANTFSARDRVEERLITVRAQSADKPAASLAGAAASSPSDLRDNVLRQLKGAAISARGTVGGLPPLRQERPPASTGCQDMKFQATEVSGLPHGLTIRLSVDVLDAGEQVIECRGIGFLPKRTPRDLPVKQEWRLWFSGPVENIALIEGFQDFFFETVDWCLQISPGVEESSAVTFGHISGA